MAVIEDKPEIIEQVQFYADKGEYEVVAIATDMSQAQSLIDDIEKGVTEVDGILFDANLCPSRNCGMDAKILYNEIKNRKIGAYLLGFSSKAMADYDHGIEVDKDIRKNAHHVASALGILMSA